MLVIETFPIRARFLEIIAQIRVSNYRYLSCAHFEFDVRRLVLLQDYVMAPNINNSLQQISIAVSGHYHLLNPHFLSGPCE